MNLNKCFTSLLLALVGIFGFTSCGDDVTEQIIYEGAVVKTRDITVERKGWGWNPVYNRYEFTKSVPEIDKRLYEYGTIVGSVFVVEEDSDNKTYEVQKNLPFIQSYIENGASFTEMISFDIFYGNGSSPSVTFYIQASDGSGETPVLPQKIHFKLALIWDSETK